MVRRAVNTSWSSGCVDWRARLAGRRSGGLHAGPARSGRARRQGCRHGVSGATVHVVRRLSPKRRVGKHAVVFVDVERDQSSDGGDAIQRVEQPTRLSNWRGESPLAANCPIQAASISKSREGNDTCSAWMETPRLPSGQSATAVGATWVVSKPGGLNKLRRTPLKLRNSVRTEVAVRVIVGCRLVPLARGRPMSHGK